MILYNWKKIYKVSKGKSNIILDIIDFITHKEIPLNKEDYRYYWSNMNWGGDSFIINPESIILNRKNYHPNDLARYIGLASFRNYGHYKFTRDKTLDLALSPLGPDALKRNPLLTLVDDKVYFKWEELKEN